MPDKSLHEHNLHEPNLHERLAAFQAQLKACDGYGEHVKLIAVSKHQPVEAMQALFAAGLLCFGENKVQEARQKREQLSEQCELHFLGSLQKNKVKYCPDLFVCLHSIADLGTAQMLEERYAAAGKCASFCIQMNLSGEASKSGIASADELFALVEGVLAFQALRLIGLMTIPDPSYTQPQTAKIYRQLANLRERVGKDFGISAQLTELSMGMSGDYPIAIAEGATYIRIGTALFGQRRP